MNNPTSKEAVMASTDEGKPLTRAQHEKALDSHFRDRRERGLPAHRPQEHDIVIEGVEIHTLAGVAYVKTDGEVSLSKDALSTVIQELQAAFQAVS